jgi:hypothetical protein
MIRPICAWQESMMIHRQAQLVVPSWKTHGLCDSLEFDGIVENSSLTQFADLSPKDLLPWCLTRRVLEWSHFLLSLLNLL